MTFADAVGYLATALGGGGIATLGQTLVRTKFSLSKSEREKLWDRVDKLEKRIEDRDKAIDDLQSQHGELQRQSNECEQRYQRCEQSSKLLQRRVDGLNVLVMRLSGAPEE